MCHVSLSPSLYPLFCANLYVTYIPLLLSMFLKFPFLSTNLTRLSASVTNMLFASLLSFSFISIPYVFDVLFPYSSSNVFNSSFVIFSFIFSL